MPVYRKYLQLYQFQLNQQLFNAFFIAVIQYCLNQKLRANIFLPLSCNPPEQQTILQNKFCNYSATQKTISKFFDFF